MLTKEFVENQSLLERIDIFGIGINIRFNKKAEYKSKIGGLFTLIILSVLAYQIKLISDNLFDTSNPFVLFEQTFTSEPSRYNLTNDKFTMSFGLQNPKSQHYIDPTVYSAILYIKQTVKNLDPTTGLYVPTTINRIVQTEPCREDHFKIEQVKSYFIGLAYQKMYCISLDETDLFLQGQFDANHYSTLRLVVTSCLGDNCNPDMNDILNNGRLAVYYVDYSVIPSNKGNPFQPLGRESFWASGPEFSKLLAINFRNTYLNSDFGLIGLDIHNDNTLTFSSDRELITPKSGNAMYDCYISLEKNVNSAYRRSYNKLDKAISQFGGIFNILFALGAVFCKPLSQIELNLKLINRLFNFENDQNNEEKKKLKEGNNNNQLKDEVIPNKLFNANKAPNQSQSLHILQSNKQQKKSNMQNSCQKDEFSISKIMMSQQSNFQLTNKLSQQKEKTTKENKEEIQKKQQLNQQQNQKEEQSNQLKKFFNITSNNISFKGWQYYKNFFKYSNLCKNRKHILLQKGVDKLYHQIDIFYLIQKMLEIEKLKRLMLTENQIKLFEFIPKPTLTSSERKDEFASKQIDILYEDDKDFVEKTADAHQAFQTILNSQQKPSKIDARILELLDPNFKQFLHEKEFKSGDLSILNRNAIDTIDLQKSNYKFKDFITEDQPLDIEMISKREEDTEQLSQRQMIESVYNKSPKSNQINLINN